MMSGWVPRNKLHIIVATSALEAGVNICGLDYIIIPNAAKCSKESLMQRIGRGGRSSGRPTVIVIGANEEEMPDLFQDPKAFFGESASKELCVASTKLMMKHSDRQLLGNRVQLEEISK